MPRHRRHWASNPVDSWPIRRGALNGVVYRRPPSYSPRHRLNVAKLPDIEAKIAALEDEYVNPAEATIQGKPDWDIRNEYAALLAARIDKLNAQRTLDSIQREQDSGGSWEAAIDANIATLDIGPIAPRSSKAHSHSEAVTIVHDLSKALRLLRSLQLDADLVLNRGQNIDHRLIAAKRVAQGLLDALDMIDGRVN